MQIARAFPYRPVLGALSAVSLAVAYWLLFRAGCAADLKSGIGDVRLALQFENAALPFFVFGIAAPLVLIGSLTHLPLHQRVGIASACALFVAPVLWMLGIQFEVWGVQHCF